MRKLIPTTLFCAATAFAADPFIGTWKINMDRTINANPSFREFAEQIRARGLESIKAQAGGIGEMVRIEPNGAGIKLTASVGSWTNWFTTDFNGGETNVRDDSGKVVERVRLTRKGANEIEATILGSPGERTVWRVSPDGRSLQFEAIFPDGDKLVGWYDRAK